MGNGTGTYYVLYGTGTKLVLRMYYTIIWDWYLLLTIGNVDWYLLLTIGNVDSV